MLIKSTLGEKFCSIFTWLHLQHMEVPGPGAELEPTLLTYTTVAVTLELSNICDLHHTLWQCLILNPLCLPLPSLQRTHLPPLMPLIFHGYCLTHCFALRIQVLPHFQCSPSIPR